MIWIVTELFYPDEVSTALIMTEIAEELAKSSDVSVICGPKGYEKTYKPQESSFNDKIVIKRVNIVPLNKNNLLARVLRLLLLSFKMTYKVIRLVQKNDHVILVTNPAFLLLALGIIKPFKKFKLSILIHDVFPENLVPGNILKSASWKYKLLKSVYDTAYRKADKLIVLGKDMKQLMSNKLRHHIPPVEVITNWADEGVFPLAGFNKSEYLGFDVTGKVVLGFAGNLGRLQGLPEFLGAFKAASNKDVVLVLIGDGALKKEIKSIIENEKVENVVLLGAKPRHEQNLFLNACDIGLVTLKAGMCGLGVPSKTYNIMAAGKALLYMGDKKSEVDSYIKNYLCGWSFSVDELEELTSFLSNLCDEKRPAILVAGQNAHNAATKFYSRKKVLSKFQTI